MSGFKGASKQIAFALALISAVLGGVIWGRVSERSKANEQLKGLIYRFAGASSNKISQTLSLIDSEYVDNVVLDSLADKVIPAILKELDPHSTYIAASEMQRVNEPLDGEFEGVGIVFNMATDTIIVLNVIPSGPSDKAGVKSRDRIIMIGDSLVAGKKIPQSDVVKQLRGPRGSVVHLSLERQGIDELVEVDVTRDVIPIKSIESAFMVNDSVGYVRMSQFARSTHTELIHSVAKLRAEGMTKLMLDLRDNSGGFLDQAILIANEFLPKGMLIVYTEDRDKTRMEEYSDGRGNFQDLTLQVLINENSASSSEILAGAIQDNDRGTIIGRRSYGKGLVQRQIPYSDGSALRLTIARYFTPTGRSIQKPYTMGDGDGYHHDLVARIEHNEMFSADSIQFVDSLKKVTPKGKVVYGGGGIMPDIFVPVDTTSVTKYFVEVSGRNVLYHYTIDYSDKNRDALANIKSMEQLAAHWATEKNLLSDFVAYALRKGVEPVWDEINKSQKIIEAQIRAYVSRNTSLEENGFYVNIFPVDDIVQRALGE
ncbi:MAG: S41 family peptidase [Rikenellaceae bacterium]